MNRIFMNVVVYLNGEMKLNESQFLPDVEYLLLLVARSQSDSFYSCITKRKSILSGMGSSHGDINKVLEQSIEHLRFIDKGSLIYG